MINIALDSKELDKFCSELLNTSGFEIDRINFDIQDIWRINNGKLSHKSGGFFHVIGLKTEEEQKKEIFLFQPQSALTGLLVHKANDDIYVLVQARIEPGNTGVLQLGPTIQSTPSNFLRTHGGKSTSYLDYFYSANDHVVGFNSTNHLDLGKIYYQKTKWLNFALVDQLIETEDSFIWTPLSVLAKAARKDYLLNTDLRSLLAVYDWDSQLRFQSKIDFSQSKILQYYLENRTRINCNDSFVAINKTEDFCVTNNAIYSKSDKNSEIGLYLIKTKHREVSEWIQPLWKAKNKGVVVLYCRNYTSMINLEFLLTVQYEKGISGNFSISPSYLRYPNEKIEKSLSHAGETLHEFHQSDEGGRFINHEYLFRVAEVQKNFQIEENQFWVNSVELKNILSMHNMANIQLRNICSALIEKLNPNIFKHKL